MLSLFELSSRVSVERVRNTYITVCACCTGVMSVDSIWQLYTCVGDVCVGRSDSRTLASVPSIGLIAERDSRGFASLCSAARFMLSSLINNKIESAR